MTNLPRAHVPPVDLGACSLVLGTSGLLLFFLPVLGIPISGVALLLGVIGWFAALAGETAKLRLAIAGVVVSGLALMVGIAIALAPEEYLGSRRALPPWQSVLDRPYVPPPARPGDLAGPAIRPASGRSRPR